MTLNLYKSNINVRIKPGIGHFRLSKLTTTHIQRFYNGLMKGDKPLTAKTVKNIHGVLHRAPEQAVRLGFIKANPSDNVSLPRVQRAEIKPMADDDIKTLQENLGHHTAAFTLNVYGHVSDKMRQESARRMDLYFKNISNQSKAKEDYAEA